MTEETFKCPNCGFEIPVTKALSQQIERDMAAKHEARVAAARSEERALAAKERAALEAAAAKKAREGVDIEMKDLQARVEEQKKRLDGAQKNELAFRRRQRELEDKAKELELEAARKVDEERAKIFEQAAAKVEDEHRLKIKEKDLLLDQMRKTIEELRKKADQGPQERQGEVQELVLEDMLAEAFKLDEIEPVAKGKRGADIVQKIKTGAGKHVGTILWESKRVKNWADVWISKLKDDQREKRAEVAVLVSEVLPEGVKGIGCVDDVWVADFASFLGLALALRRSLIDVALARSAMVGQQGKAEMLYGYVTSVQFRQRVEAIIESFKAQKSDLEGEKAAMQRYWARRDKQIERMLMSTAAMVGDLEGITGKELPAIKTLELPEAEAGGDSDKITEEEKEP